MNKHYETEDRHKHKTIKFPEGNRRFLTSALGRWRLEHQEFKLGNMREPILKKNKLKTKNKLSHMHVKKTFIFM